MVSLLIYDRNQSLVSLAKADAESITAMSVLKLLPNRTGGSIREHFSRGDGSVVDLAQQDPTGSLMRSIRGNEIAMIFQEPMTSLNPVWPVGQQIVEQLRCTRSN